MGFHCGAPYGMGIWGFDASISDGPWDVGPLGTDDGAVGDWGDGRVRLAGRWEWEIPPPAAWPKGNAAGGLWLRL